MTRADYGWRLIGLAVLLLIGDGWIVRGGHVGRWYTGLDLASRAASGSLRTLDSYWPLEVVLDPSEGSYKVVQARLQTLYFGFLAAGGVLSTLLGDRRASERALILAAGAVGSLLMTYVADYAVVDSYLHPLLGLAVGGFPFAMAFTSLAAFRLGRHRTAASAVGSLGLLLLLGAWDEQLHRPPTGYYQTLDGLRCELALLGAWLLHSARPRVLTPPSRPWPADA